MSKPPVRFPRRQFLKASGAATLATALGTRAFGAKDMRIVRAAIHPAIGVARIGNSESSFFIGPEVTEPPKTQVGQSRDGAGALKRQAARFRIYGYNAAGEVVQELTASTAEITWQVHVANKKAAWYQFLAALDLPEASALSAARRNPKITGDARKALEIDPGPRQISGTSRAGSQFRFDSAQFNGTAVCLGEIRTDALGRLIFLGGLGKAGSPASELVYNESDNDSFNNAAGWYDDISDGPVTASVAIGGQTIPVTPAWVIVGPPNYAPDLVGWRTAYELLTDVYIASGFMPAPAKTSFTNDILPIFQRLGGLQWVNKGLANLYSRGTELDFENPKLIARLADKREVELRKNIQEHFRLQESESLNRALWPMMYGDSYGSFNQAAHENMQVPSLFKLHLQRWLNGDFVNDWNLQQIRRRKPLRRLEDVPIAQQPAMLDKAALHFCLADAFHPGCELTWPIRHITMFSSPFRIKHRAANTPPVDFGDKLTQAIVRQENGPLYAQGPGDLTRWMAIPWQGDTVFCRSGYEPELDPYLPTYWPARVPNHVLTAADYEKVMDAQLPREERRHAFEHREHWLRAWQNLSAPDQIQAMIDNIGAVGVIEARPGPIDDPDFPQTIYVESLPVSLSRSVPPGGAGQGAGRPKSTTNSSDSHEDVLAREAGFKDAAQLRAFRKARGLK